MMNKSDKGLDAQVDAVLLDEWVEPRRRRGKRGRRHKRGTPEEIRARRRDRRKRVSATGASPKVLLHDEKLGEQQLKPVSLSRGRLREMTVPDVFSLLDAPEPTMKFLNDLLSFSGTNLYKHISFQAKQCRMIGLDALVAMSVFVLRAKRRRRDENRLTVSGTWPEDLSMKVMFKASGMPHHLGLPESKLTPEQEKMVHRCELYSGLSAKGYYALGRQRNEATEQVRKYFDRCLNTVGFTLTRGGKNRIDKLMSEVIGNAEEHGGPWYTIGHWQLGEKDVGRRYGVCQIALFNFGNTIYESFLADEASPTIVEQLRTLSDVHVQKGWFEKLRGSWDEETLWTLYAIQERVSRYSGLPGHETRGNGTRDIVDFFLELGSPGTMCIVSGHSYILFDGSHHFHEIQRGEDQLKIITFNESGSLDDPPERKYVRRLAHPFPGTMVSIRLTLDEHYLTRIAGEKDA
jgi:hypothetical protein